MKRDRIHRLLVVLLGLLAFASLPLLSGPPETPSPEAACPPCNDSNPCTTDTCDTSTGTCRYEVVSCNDGNPCTQDSCNIFASRSPCRTTGCCNNPLTGPACDDGNSCTSGDLCSTGICHGSALPPGTTCEDRNSCTDLDTCNDAGACVGSALPTGTLCDDGTACTTGDMCALDETGAPRCLGAAVSCSDGSPCTQDVCDPATGACSNPPVNCDDGNQCTADSIICAGGLVCQHTPQNGSCQDVSLCTPDDFCSGGICVSGGSCDDHIDCTHDLCVGDEGCFHNPDNTLCLDNRFCTFDERCTLQIGCTLRVHVGATCPPDVPCGGLGVCNLNGDCNPVGPPCDDQNSCTQDSCDEGTNTCSHVVSGDACCASGTFNPSAGLPELTIDSVSPSVLSPANHKLLPVTLAFTAQTECGAPLTAMLISVTSNQPDDAPGPTDGHTIQDIQGADLGQADTSILLRAERDRIAGERIYTITYSASANGSTVFAQKQVSVPASHKQTAQTPTNPRQKPKPKE